MKIVFTVEADHIGIFFELLFTGIIIHTQTGCSIRALLSGRLGIDNVYIDQRIQTIFLDGRAIDEIDHTIVESESVLALSGAMPGLAGAVFRKGGKFSPMRSTAEAGYKSQSKHLTDGFLILKMFNQVAADIGPLFLQNGIYVSGGIFHRFLNQKIQDLIKISAVMDIGGKNQSLEDAVSIDFSVAEVLLTIKSK